MEFLDLPKFHTITFKLFTKIVGTTKPRNSKGTIKRISFIVVLSILLTCMSWNTLFISEEVFWINCSLDLHQPVKIVIEVLDSINSSFFIAIISKTVGSNIKVPVI
ncbi:hypothetical protein V8G54_001309 [Vigna mungo]|uniref:Uncharacterized protein n=1 Tax=Vigna mungo TaxID=3915 RepID=A0AAQ3P808_VIGMU